MEGVGLRQGVALHHLPLTGDCVERLPKHSPQGGLNVTQPRGSEKLQIKQAFLCLASEVAVSIQSTCALP